MIKDKFSKYNKPLSRINENCLIFLRFICNFNEALLSAEFVQTFFKFLGINIWSSTLIWGIPPILLVFFGPIFRKYVLNKKYDTFLNNMILLSCLFFLNSLGFITLFNLESYTANQMYVSNTILILGGIAFTSIDFTKFLYEDHIFPYMDEYVCKSRRAKFKYWGLVFEKIGRVFGAFISCLYVLLRRTNSFKFSDSFLTNMQFTYYFAICFNSLTVFIIFMCWPKHFHLQEKPILHKSTSTIDFFFPGINYIKKLEKNNQYLLIRLFFVLGIYWFVCVTITQWVSNKFMRDYPNSISNSAIQAVDVGTAWGSIGLTLFYTLWGLGHIITNPFRKVLMKYSKVISRFLNLYGAVMYFMSYYFYHKNIKILVLCLGFCGVSFDWVLVQKITEKVHNDYSLIELNEKVRKFRVKIIMGLVEFLSELTFFIIVPCMLNDVSDCHQMVIFSFMHLFLAFSVPLEHNFEV